MTRRTGTAIRQKRFTRARSKAHGDVAQLAVAYDYFRAELAVFAAAPDGDTEPAAMLTDYIWQATQMIREMNEETE